MITLTLLAKASPCDWLALPYCLVFISCLTDESFVSWVLEAFLQMTLFLWNTSLIVSFAVCFSFCIVSYHNVILPYKEVHSPFISPNGSGCESRSLCFILNGHVYNRICKQGFITLSNNLCVFDYLCYLNVNQIWSDHGHIELMT